MRQDRTPVDPMDPVSLAVNGISGQMRRTMVRDMLTAEGAERARHDPLLGPIEPDLLEEQASEEFRHAMSAMAGPTWMGGEHLPPLPSTAPSASGARTARVSSDSYGMWGFPSPASSRPRDPLHLFRRLQASMTTRMSGSRSREALRRVTHDTPKNTRIDSTSDSPDTVTPTGNV